jgi:hypothetical protein
MENSNLKPPTAQQPIEEERSGPDNLCSSRNRKGSDEEQRIEDLIIGCTLDPTTLGCLKDITGFEDAKSDIITSLLLPFQVPHASSYGIRQNNMFLLYGLPSRTLLKIYKINAARSLHVSDIA